MAVLLINIRYVSFIVLRLEFLAFVLNLMES